MVTRQVTVTMIPNYGSSGCRYGQTKCGDPPVSTHPAIPTTTVALAACKMLQQQCVHGRYLRLPRRLRPVRRSLYRSRVGYDRWNAWEQLRFAMASLRLGYEALVPPVWHRVQLGK